MKRDKLCQAVWNVQMDGKHLSNRVIRGMLCCRKPLSDNTSCFVHWFKIKATKQYHLTKMFYGTIIVQVIFL